MATRLQAASEAVRDVIKKSQLISSSSEDPPSRYRLLTTRTNLNENDSVRKWTFGQRDSNMKNKILLMVGETGTGKTTLINAMVNYILGVKFTDEVWFEVTEEEGDNPTSDQSQSQTSQITVYEVFAKDNATCFTIIDTPGYGDTRGTDVDKKIAENLFKLFQSDTGVKEIDAVCLVVKASENRLSDRQQYIFDAVLSLFGKDIENNIVMFITHSDGLPPDNALNAIKKARIPCRKDEENEPEHYLFNNRQTERRIKKYNRALQTAWELTEESLNDFFDSLKEQNRKSLKQTEEVLKESKRLEACITNLQDRIDFVERKGKELAQIQKALEENQEKIKKNENFTFKVTTSFREKVPIENASWWNRKATSCSVCQENCHEYGCWAAIGASRCSVMKNDHCTSCTGKCHHNKHVKENKKYVTRSKDTVMSYNELIKKYEGNNVSESDTKFDTESFKNVREDLESNKKEKEEKINIVKRLKEDIDKNEKQKADLIEEAYTAIIKLCKIALKSDSAFIVQTIDFLIPRAEETGKDVVACNLKKLRELKPESEETVNAAAGYFSRLMNALTNKK
ncbi:uncharacterized protein Hap1MRO34_010197 [Clarias gariepinus]|uniref:uncharacterized protein LOC128527908 n=1 Tax=Clarias gariepinus TaxID=13013 RepID=UPI00234D72F7|nr:uncharacterized protein LOC128527908 [Clarias gariepinus]